MANARIMIVEDEAIVALDLQHKLKTLGYAVSGVASSGEEAVRKVPQTRPDLVLMDIKLKGDMDGIEAAQRIRDEFNIPVVYLTAYSDENTLQRAKVTEPAGYLLKPFKDREVYATIEMALYKHKMEMELKKSAQRFATIVLSIGDAVIATDLQGRVTFMNPVAETLTGWNLQDAIGRDMSDVFNIVNEDTREAIDSGISDVLKNGVGITLPSGTVLIRRNNLEIPIADGAAPIKDYDGNVTGVVVVFRRDREQTG